MRVAGEGLSAEVEAGWDLRITRTAGGGPDEASAPYLHAANFPLPARRGNFGGEALEVMRPGDVFVALVEYGPDDAGQPLFAHHGCPRALPLRAYRPDVLARIRSGLMGTQAFFSEQGRPFCLHAVITATPDRATLVQLVNRFLTTIAIEPPSIPPLAGRGG